MSSRDRVGQQSQAGRWGESRGAPPPATPEPGRRGGGRFLCTPGLASPLQSHEAGDPATVDGWEECPPTRKLRVGGALLFPRVSPISRGELLLPPGPAETVTPSGGGVRSLTLTPGRPGGPCGAEKEQSLSPRREGLPPTGARTPLGSPGAGVCPQHHLYPSGSTQTRREGRRARCLHNPDLHLV